jgi:hypothetical protein
MDAYLQCLHKGFEIRDREADMGASGKMAGRGLKKFEASTREEPLGRCFHLDLETEKERDGSVILGSDGWTETEIQRKRGKEIDR